MLCITLIICLFCVYVETKKSYGNLQTIEQLKKGNEIVKKEKYFDSYLQMTEIENFLNICDDYENEECAKEQFEEIDFILKRNSNRMTNVEYQYSSNINEENEKLKIKFYQNYIKFEVKMKEKLRKFQWKKFQSFELKRIFQLLTTTIVNKNETISQRLVNISIKIEFIYNNGRPCYIKCLGKGESGINNLFQTERNYDKLLGYWTSWRNETGRKIRKLFIEKVKLENIGAKENGYSDAASFNLKNEFEEDDFKDTIIKLYEEILPFYKELHAYVRYCLSRFYPGKIDNNGSIPAHLLGNLWAQQWGNIFPILQKCVNINSSYNNQNNISLKLQTISVNKMFKISEDFFTSLGMYKMTPNFWKRSILLEQQHKLIDCHGSASDFSNGHDYRILMCTKKTINDFLTIHHEMGHIEYFMAYKDLPHVFQNSANSGFHEAIGDTLTLSVSTLEHLRKISLIPSFTITEDSNIQYLLTIALNKVAFLPFALTMESFIWSVYNGSVSEHKLNEHWWNLRHRYQGIKPPIQRTEYDFDPGAKYHIAFGVSYIRYFISFILQFQFYEAMCKLSGHTESLHLCDFYDSKIAGKKLLEMLKKGNSQNWRDTLKILTDSREISSKSLMKYFEPLYKWLKKNNERLNLTVGW